MNKLRQKTVQKQTQNLVLRPKMLQSIEMLTMPKMELATYLKQEMINNPMLELIEKDNDYDEVEELEEEPELSEEEKELEKTLEETKELSEILDSLNEDYGGTNKHNNGSKDKKREMFEKLLQYKKDRKQDFFFQLEQLPIKKNEFEFSYDLVESANEYGFLPEDFDIYAFGKEYDIKPERVDELHYIIKHLNPKGITSRTIQECLVSQIDETDENNEMLIKLIEEDFDNLIHRRYKKIIKKYDINMNTLMLWKEQIAHFDPKPGLRLENNEAKYIVPDVIIKKIGEEFEVIVNDYNFPKVRMSRRYKKILSYVKYDKKAVKYVRNKINAAKFLIKSVYMRNRTLQRVVHSIIEHQADFFYNESGVLNPLTYADIANELNVNESTISRVVRTKYADTPFGIMCLKDMFSSKAGKRESYESVSRQSVEKQIIKLIENEDKKKPYTDQKIADIFKERGINVSRRLVNKYRKSLGILNSNLRKKKF